MTFNESTAHTIAKLWGFKRSTVARWRETDTIPDGYITEKGEFKRPLTPDDFALQKKVLSLVGAGWLNGRALSRLIGHEDKINSLLLARRNPNDPRYSLRHLSATETDKLKVWLRSFERLLTSVLYRANYKPDDTAFQDDLRLLLASKELVSTNVLAGMDKATVARFWAFVRGRSKVSPELVRLLLANLSRLATMLL
jgi:hypothetical protein